MNNAIIKFACVIVLTVLIIVFQSFFRKGSEFADNGLFVMRYSRKIRSMCLVIIFLCPGVPLSIIVKKGWPLNFDDQLFSAVFLGIGTLFGYALFWLSRIKIALFEEGIAKNYVYGSVRFIPWSEITTVKSRFFSGLIYIMTEESSRWISVSHHMDGIDVLFREMKARLDPEVYGNELEKPLNNFIHIG